MAQVRIPPTQFEPPMTVDEAGMAIIRGAWDTWDMAIAHALDRSWSGWGKQKVRKRRGKWLVGR